MDTVIGFLRGTPWYVYLILVYLIFIGIKSVKGGVVHIKKLFIIPLIFVIMSVDEIVSKLNFKIPYLLACILGLIIGAYIGWWQFSRLKIRVDQTKKLLEIEGSWFALFLLIITFIVKYYVAYNLTINYDMPVTFTCCLLLASSIFTGVFIGRLFYGIRKLNVGPHVNLIEINK